MALPIPAIHHGKIGGQASPSRALFIPTYVAVVAASLQKVCVLGIDYTVLLGSNRVCFATFWIMNFWVISVQICLIIYIVFENLGGLYIGLPYYVMIFIVYLVPKVIHGFKLHRIAFQQFLEAKMSTLESSALALLQQNLGCLFRRRFSLTKL